MGINTKLIKEDDYITTEWSGGKTTQIFIYPNDSDYKVHNFKFRLSSATVELERSEFTKLEGIHRFITPLNGELKLTHNRKDYINLRSFEIYEFDGDIETISYGKVRDFNLMLGNGARGKLESIYINREYSVVKESQSDFNQTIYFIYAYNSTIYIDSGKDKIRLSPFQTLLIEINSNPSLKLNIKSENPTNILLGTIYI